MCQTRTISYTCGHTCSFRLSKCGGTFTHVNKKSREQRASCAGYAVFTNYSTNECGPCSKATCERRLDEKMRELSLSLPVTDSWTVDEPEELTRAKENREQELFLLNQRFPDGRFKKTVRPEKGLTRTRIGERRSKLSVEVMPDDIVTEDNDEVSYSDGTLVGGWADSSEGWPRLEDEIAENQAAQEAAGVTVCWGPWSGQKDSDEEVYHTWKADDEVETAKSADSSAKAMDDVATWDGEQMFTKAQDNGSRIDERVDDACAEQNSFGILDTMLSVGG